MDRSTINHIFKGYEPFKGALDTGRNGALISMASGESSGYAMAPLQARGTFFIHPQTQGIFSLLFPILLSIAKYNIA